MTDGEILVAIMKEHGVPIDAIERVKVARDIDEAIKRHHIVIIHRGNTPIGFLTYTPNEKHIFIDYCFVYPKYRDSFSLIGLRGIFRRIGNKFRWRIRRRGRYCEVK